jgi:DNA-directed RNA polymerase sigma subunit (sigma70/sigma32)
MLPVLRLPQRALSAFKITATALDEMLTTREKMVLQLRFGMGNDPRGLDAHI